MPSVLINEAFLCMLHITAARLSMPAAQIPVALAALETHDAPSRNIARALCSVAYFCVGAVHVKYFTRVALVTSPLTAFHRVRCSRPISPSDER